MGLTIIDDVAYLYFKSASSRVSLDSYQFSDLVDLGCARVKCETKSGGCFYHTLVKRHQIESHHKNGRNWKHSTANALESLYASMVFDHGRCSLQGVNDNIINRTGIENGRSWRMESIMRSTMLSSESLDKTKLLHRSQLHHLQPHRQICTESRTSFS